MLNFHKDHRNLVNVALLVFVLLSMGIAIMPASALSDGTQPLPGMPKMTPEQRRGLEVYVAENCAACHTQQVRNIAMDKPWGARPSIPSDYAYSKQRLDVWRASPSVLGSERTGPDLTNVGQRQPGAQWHLLHLYDPRMVVKGSIMPRYAWLFEETAHPAADAVVVPVPKERLSDTAHVVVATPQALDLVAYLISLQQAPLPEGEAPAFLPSPRGPEKTDQGAAGDAAADGEALFKGTCSACHQPEGQGLAGAFPPLAGSPIVNAEDPTQMLSILLGGYDARAEYGVMPPQAAQFTDAQIAAVATYVRSHFGNKAPAVAPEAVAPLRAQIAPETLIVP